MERRARLVARGDGLPGDTSSAHGRSVGRPNSSWFHQLPHRPMAWASASAGARPTGRLQRDAPALGGPDPDGHAEADAAPDAEAALPDLEDVEPVALGTAASR